MVYSWYIYTHRIHGAGILMLTWLGYIDGMHVTIYSSTMDPMGIYIYLHIYTTNMNSHVQTPEFPRFLTNTPALPLCEGLAHGHAVFQHPTETSQLSETVRPLGIDIVGFLKSGSPKWMVFVRENPNLKPPYSGYRTTHHHHSISSLTTISPWCTIYYRYSYKL